MRRSSLAAGLLLLPFVLPTPLPAQQAEKEVLAVTRAMLDVLKTRDAESVRRYLIPETRFTLTRPAPTGGVRVLAMTGEQFLAAVTRESPQVVEELIRNPVVQIDGDLATVWTEYQVLVDGAVHHCGYDAFQLVRMSDGWKVLNVSDTYREQGCGGPWSGGS